MVEYLKPFTCRLLPEELTPLTELALDVRWTWNHGSDRLWRMMDPQTWEVTRNPWWILQSISQEKLEQVISNPDFRKELERVSRSHQNYLRQPEGYRKNAARKFPGSIAYFSLEFGLGEAIPLYAGGLGILAGDYLKTASDLSIPLVGVGLLYQHGYFRQILAEDGTQISANPPLDPTSLPMRPVTDAQGGWLRVPLDLPGRVLLLRAWQVQVGKVTLYLLDSNDPMNDPADRSIIFKLYDDQPEFRLMQEMILGIGGWKLLEMVGLKPEVSHFNEGHAAFVVLERARSYMQKTGHSFGVALWATRAGNIFTTHTAVAAGFDVFPGFLMERYFKDYALKLGLTLDQFLALGRQNPLDSNEPFNMAILAMRGSTAVNGVSQLHGKVSRQLLQPLFPRWPQQEVPVDSVTNGVHMPSWDSQSADDMWMKTAGKNCWGGNLEHIPGDMQGLSDEALWTVRKEARRELVNNVRRRIDYQFRQYAAEPNLIEEVQQVLDPEALTIGFARRFATYKRPNLLLTDKERLVRILTNPERPVQLVVAGKAHPKDEAGKKMIQEMVNFSRQAEIRKRMVFLPDYDIELGQEMVQGIDVWINTPRRPWEACGTSGMKVLVNGGLNVSELDGWWAEAYSSDLGWSIGDGEEHGPEWDKVEADHLYDLLEREIVSEFYDRNPQGIPEKWVQRIRNSICALAVQFSSNRMLGDYLDKFYSAAMERYRRRVAVNGSLAKELDTWQQTLQKHWPDIRFGETQLERKGDSWGVDCEIFTGGLDPRLIRVELFAESKANNQPVREAMAIVEKRDKPETLYIYRGTVPTVRPADHYSIRVMAYHPAAVVPLEENHILWKHPI
jgi:glycogen phosphorylase